MTTELVGLLDRIGQLADQLRGTQAVLDVETEAKLVALKELAAAREKIAELERENARNLNTYAEESHKANRNWWLNLETGEPIARNVGELLMLAVSELAEAMEGHRKNLMDDKLPHRAMFEVELADCLIRIFDLAGRPPSRSGRRVSGEDGF